MIHIQHHHQTVCTLISHSKQWLCKGINYYFQFNKRQTQSKLSSFIVDIQKTEAIRISCTTTSLNVIKSNYCVSIQKLWRKKEKKRKESRARGERWIPLSSTFSSRCFVLCIPIHTIYYVYWTCIEVSSFFLFL